MKQRIGYIGLGLMGGSLARHLLSAGFPLTVHDLDPAKVDAIVKAGGKAASSPDQVAPQVDVIIMSLPDSQVVAKVVNDSLRLFETGRKGLILLDTSTADPPYRPNWPRDSGRRESRCWTPPSAEPVRCAPPKKASSWWAGRRRYSSSASPCSPRCPKTGFTWRQRHGRGDQAGRQPGARLDSHGACRRAYAAKKAGLDQSQTLEVLKKSAAYSKSMDQKGYRMVNRHFLPPEGPLAMHYKDVQLMLALGAKLGCPLPLLSLNAQALASEISKGRGEWDTSDIISFYDELANV